MEYTPQKAIDSIDEVLNSTIDYDESLEYEISSYDFDWLEIAKSALEKQIPKKPYKTKEHKQNNWYCSTCKCYLGDDMELQNACLQPKFCEHCGQRIDWSETKGNVGKEKDD